MTLQMLIRRYAAALAIASTGFTAAQAQPSAAGTVSPPVRADIALSGKVLAAHDASNHLACQSECKGTAGCTGYSFNRNAKASCTLLGGTLADVAVTGAVSCRMPCDASPVKTALAQPLAGVLLRDPNATKPAVATRLPAPPVAPARPQQIAPLLAAPGPLVAVAPVAPPPGPNAKPSRVPHLASKSISGFEVVAGSTVNVAPLSTATVEAQCPGGKIAISAGYLAVPANPSQPLAARGLEIHQAQPDGAVARVTLRNANVFEAGTIQAFAVCINPIPGLRVAANPARSLNPATCTDEERVIGGGFMATAEGTWVYWAAPKEGPAAGGSWAAPLARNAFAPKAAANSVMAICAPKASVPGWALKDSVMLSLGAQSSGTLRVGCDAGTPIGAGIDNSAGDISDFMPFSFNGLTFNSGEWTAVIWNINLFAGPNAVKARLRVICAQMGP